MRVSIQWRICLKVMIVCKFGGSSVATKRGLECIKQIVNNPQRRVIVFSALGKRFAEDDKITDLLINCYVQYAINNNIESSLQIVKQRFKIFCKSLKLNFDINTEFNKITKTFYATKSADYLISRGEYLTCKILAKYFNIKFIDATQLLYFKNFKPNLSKTENALQNILKKHKQIVVPGFYGINNNSLFIFQRGGGDYSGALLSVCSQAKIYENYTDVCGLFEINPVYAKNAKQIPKISFNELELMSAFDASVIQSECIDILKNSRTKLIIKNTYKSKPVTVVTATCKQQTNYLITSRNNTQGLILLRHKTKNLKKRIKYYVRTYNLSVVRQEPNKTYIKCIRQQLPFHMANIYNLLQ